MFLHRRSSELSFSVDHLSTRPVGHAYRVGTLPRSSQDTQTEVTYDRERRVYSLKCTGEALFVMDQPCQEVELVNLMSVSFWGKDEPGNQHVYKFHDLDTLLDPMHIRMLVQLSSYSASLDSTGRRLRLARGFLGSTPLDNLRPSAQAIVASLRRAYQSISARDGGLRSPALDRSAESAFDQVEMIMGTCVDLAHQGASAVTRKRARESATQEPACPCCLEELSPDKAEAYPCGHKVCMGCQKHLKEYEFTSCPVCRS
jgi:hypothetical protein